MSLWTERTAVPADVSPELRAVIFAVDGYKCVFCGSTEDLQIDHVVPRAAGGRSTADNLATLNRKCNKYKSNYNIDWAGRTWYRPWPGYDDARLAARILRREQRVQRSWSRRRRLRRALRGARL